VTTTNGAVEVGRYEYSMASRLRVHGERKAVEAYDPYEFYSIIFAKSYYNGATK